jgi:iron complex outermembrane receptor protein
MSADYDFVGAVDVSGVGETWFHVIQNNERPTIFSLAFPLEAANFTVSQRDAYSVVNLRAGVSADPLVVGGLHRQRDGRELPAGSHPAPEFGGSFIHRAASAAWAWRQR